LTVTECAEQALLRQGGTLGIVERSSEQFGVPAFDKGIDGLV
jgi:hypothetical protein